MFLVFVNEISPFLSGGFMQKRFRAFTLVELLVVIAVIAVLMSLIMPSFSQARQVAIQLNCMSRMRAYNTYIEAYRQDFKGWYPVNTTWSSAGYANWYDADWEVQIQAYFPTSNYVMAFNDPKNTPKTNPFLCPSHPTMPGYTVALVRPYTWVGANTIMGNYRMSGCFGYGGPAGLSQALQLRYGPKREIKVSPSVVMMMGEWYDASLNFGYADTINRMLYRHAATTNVLFGDGHVKGYQNVAVELNKGIQFAAN
jgi:prepilin-type N-terminal cleavage/methylation domain-containing protein/prepilin-type processing-associated H-X9-DG protein